jgi:hypothetical protein
MGLVWIAPGILRYLKTCRLKYNDSLQIQGNANAKFFLRIQRDGRLGIVSTATTWLETVASVAGKRALAHGLEAPIQPDYGSAAGAPRHCAGQPTWEFTE